MIKKKGKLLVFIFVSLALGISNPSITPIESDANQWNINAYCVEYTNDGEVLAYSNCKEKEEEDPVFEGASVGKLVGAYICLQLANEGKLSLDDTISQYLETDWITDDSRFSNITVRHLLSHTAGFSPSFEMGVDKKMYFEPGSKFSYSGVGYLYLQKVIESITGDEFEAAARQYVFGPLGMKNSTFKKVDTLVPYVKTESLVLYIIIAWSVQMIIIFILGYIIGIITKFKYLNRISLFYTSTVLGFVSEIILLMRILERLVLPASIFGIIGFTLLWITRKNKKLRYIIFIAFLLLSSLLGSLLPISLPVGKEWLAKKTNVAYSLKTTAKDMSLFAQNLMKIYKSNETTVLLEMFEPQIEIDNANSWGLGMAIETIEGQTTYWHSGINPGMQCLLVMRPESNETIIIMTNSDYGLEFAKEVARNKLGVDGKWNIKRTDLE